MIVGDMGTNSSNIKTIYLVVITFFIGFLCAFLIFRNSPSEQKGRFIETKSNNPFVLKNKKPFVIKSDKPFYDPQRLREQASTQGGAFSNRSERGTPLVKKDIKGPIQGKVTIIDWCARVVFIDDVLFNMGSLDLIGLETGDRVKVTYTNTKQGKDLESIHVLQ